MLNLIMNGLEAMAGVDDRPCELVIRSRKSPSGEVVVSVSDSGVGFDPGDGERLFDAFFTTKPTGMGMGLSVSRSIVSSLGGELWAAPNTPYGSTFHFRLPTSHGADAGQKATGPPGRPDVTPLEAVLRRDRAVIAAALVAIAALAWALVVRLAPSTVSAGMAMPGMSGMEAGAALGIPWLTGMWAVMMAAMMLPSATPTILMFGNVTRRRQIEGRPAVPGRGFHGRLPGGVGLLCHDRGGGDVGTASPRASLTLDGRRKSRAGWWTPDRGGGVSAAADQGCLPITLPLAASLLLDGVARGRTRCGRHGREARQLLCRLLLAAHGAPVRGRRHEPPLGFTPGGARTA